MERLVSPDLRVMLWPSRAYAEYVRDATPGASLWTAARRPLFVALIQGMAISMAATHTVAAPVLASVTMCWATAVILQFVAALILIRTGPAFARGPGAGGYASHVTTARAIDLFFLGHAPWSLWLIVSAGTITLASSLPVLRWVSIAGMIVSAAVTPRIVAAFDEAVLGSSRPKAIRRAALHQGFTWTALFVYIAAGVQLWPRMVGLFQ